MISFRMSSLLFAILAFTYCKSPSATSKHTVSPAAAPTPTLSGLEQAILVEVNRHRQSIGLPALQSNSVLATEAALHSQRMASKKVPFGHNGFEARVSRIRTRLGPLSGSGENVAYGQLTAREVVKVWLNSPPHRKNIEGHYNLTGIGVSRNRQGIIYFTQIFTQKS